MLPLLLLVLLFIGIAAWGNNAVLLEIAKWRPDEPFNSVFNRHLVDHYIWSDRVPRSLRRRYIVTQAFFCPAALCVALLVRQNESDPFKQTLGIILFCALGVFCAARLIWKGIKHGF